MKCLPGEMFEISVSDSARNARDFTNSVQSFSDYYVGWAICETLLTISLVYLFDQRENVCSSFFCRLSTNLGKNKTCETGSKPCAFGMTGDM